MCFHVMKRSLVILVGVVASSFAMVAMPASAHGAPDGIEPAALLCSPELPVAGSVCTPVSQPAAATDPIWNAVGQAVVDFETITGHADGAPTK